MRDVLLVSAGALLLRIASAMVVSQPGYTDAYYFVAVATRLAQGDGLTADFVWNFIEAPGFAALPVPSHRFWVPLASTLQAAGIAVLGPLLGEFRAAQAAVVAVAAFLPAATYAAARSLAVAPRYALTAAAVVGLGGIFAPAWVATDAFVPAALLGTLFFLVFAHAAAGSARAGLVCGALVGLLYLARSEGALFGLALLALLVSPAARRAGALGSIVALAIGGAWFARTAALGAGDLFARTALLVRYEDFFAIRSPSPEDFVAALPTVLAAKAGALVTNAATALFGFAVLLGPLAALSVWRLRGRADVRAWSLLLVLVFGAQSLVWTLHSTRGSYFHSLAAFFPFGVALAAAAGEHALARRARFAPAWVAAALALCAFLTAGALSEWDTTFNGTARARMAAVDALPDGPFLAIDAAAWRTLSGRSVIVTPADDLAAAECAAARYGARALVLESRHFSAYDVVYGGGVPRWLGPAESRGGIRIHPVLSPSCVTR